MRIPVSSLTDGGAPAVKPKTTSGAASIPVAGVANVPRVPAPKPVSSVPTMPPAMQPKKTTAPKTDSAASKSMGPQGGLPAGVVAGVNPTYVGGTKVDDDKKPTGTWTKAGTVQTASGPVDVDANGIAQDGSTPVAMTETKTEKEITLVDTIIDNYGNTIGIYSDGSRKTLMSSGRTYQTTVDEDAYAILKRSLEDYGLEELFPVVSGYMDRGLGPEQATLELRKDPTYLKRFAGNEARRKAGLNALSEGEYLELENSYMQTLKAYGLTNQLGTDTASRRLEMAKIIGNDTSAVEFKDRIDTVVTRVKNADKTTKDTFKSFYGISDEDLVGYFLKPEENLPKLQQKVTAAEIGAAATTQGLKTSMDAATTLAQLGVTQEQARTGYEAIGEVLPTATKLGEIYGDKYTQATAEQEVFQGLASAKRKRQQLAERETASFSGSSGRLRTGRAQGNTGQF